MSDAPAVGLRFLALAHRIRRLIDEHLAADGVSLARLKLLQALDRLGPVHQARLADELVMAPRSVTQAVEAAEWDGLVHRTSDASDRRAKLVVLTASGRAAITTGVSAGEAALEQVFGHLDADQLAALQVLLGSVEARIAR